MANRHLAVAPVALAAGALVLTACGGGGSQASSSDADVVASFYPLAFVAGQVGGDHIELDNLTTPGIEPHDLELTPRQIGAVQDADLVVYESGFQAAVDEAVQQAEPDDAHRVDVADLVELAEHDHGAGHGDGHGHTADPHVWLDPQNMITVTEAVAQRLTAIDQKYAEAYQKNATALVQKLEKLDAAFHHGLKNCDTRTIVTSHAAFGYLAAAYDLEQIPIAGIEPSTGPSAAQLSKITDLVRSKNISTVFTEELVSPAIAETIADETGATTATLDPIEGLNDDTADETYLTLMRQNLQAIQKANNCS